MAVRHDKQKKKWMIDFWYQHPNSERRRYTRISPIQTKKGALEHERLMKNNLLDLDKGLDVGKKDIPKFKAFVEEFLSTYSLANNKISEQKQKRYICNNHLIPAFGLMNLDQIGVRDVEKLKATLLEEKELERKTVNNILGVLRKLLSYAVEIEILKSIPKIKLLKVPPQQHEFLTFEEYDQLISNLSQKDDVLLCVALLGGDQGLRQGEMAGLKWQDINWRANKITVMRSIWNGIEQSPKGGKKREIPMTTRLRSALRKIQHLKSEFVLVKENGKPWTRNVFIWRGDRMYKLAGLPRPKMCFHILRHSFCSHLAMKGIATRTIQELAGHADLSTTQKYMHLAPVELENAIKILENAPPISSDQQLFGNQEESG